MADAAVPLRSGAEGGEVVHLRESALTPLFVPQAPLPLPPRHGFPPICAHWFVSRRICPLTAGASPPPTVSVLLTLLSLSTPPQLVLPLVDLFAFPFSDQICHDLG